MSKNYYDLLGVSTGAPADEIKRAFRREIAKYHPDKVQHLGQEFQDIAVSKAAELTLAYKTLTDAAARAAYDAEVIGASAASAFPAATTATAPVSAPAWEQAKPHSPAPEPPPPPGGGSTFAQERAGASDLVRRATVARFRQALNIEFGAYDQAPVAGFEITCFPKAGRFTFRQPPRVLARFVPKVDAAAMSESFAMASRMKRDGQGDVCVFVMGPALASAGELAAVITEQRRKPAPPIGGKVVLVPVNTQTWAAHVPTDAPAVVKSLLSRLKTA